MAAGNTYTPIATTTLGSSSANYTFTSIPSTYTDLVIVFNGRCTSTGGWNFFIQFNGDTSGNYGATSMYGDGTNTGSNRSINSSQVGGFVVDGSNYGQVNVNVMNYSNTTTYKTIVGKGSTAAGSYVDARVGEWRSTSAISSILMYSNGGNWQTGPTFTLYGTTAA